MENDHDFSKYHVYFINVEIKLTDNPAPTTNCNLPVGMQLHLERGLPTRTKNGRTQLCVEHRLATQTKMGRALFTAKFLINNMINLIYYIY